jgi:nucleotide-binding universal stress UspA family protein
LDRLRAAHREDFEHLPSLGVGQGIALATALNAKATVITVTEPLPVDYGAGHAGGWIPTPEEFDRFDAACKERAGMALEKARAMAEQIGVSVELLHVPDAHPATAIIKTAKSKGCDLSLWPLMDVAASGNYCWEVKQRKF